MRSQNNNETIGDKIKQLRNKQGLTQDELARKSDQTVAKIAKALDVSIKENNESEFKENNIL